MTHQNLRLGKCWKLFQATLNGLQIQVKGYFLHSSSRSQISVSPLGWYSVNRNICKITLFTIAYQPINLVYYRMLFHFKTAELIYE